MPDLRPILLVEDSPRDIELTMAALAKCQLANEIVVARDGAEALKGQSREAATLAAHPRRDADILAGGTGPGAKLRSGGQRLRG